MLSFLMICFKRLPVINSLNLRAILYKKPSGSILIDGTGGVIMIFKFGISVWMILLPGEKKWGLRFIKARCVFKLHI